MAFKDLPNDSIQKTVLVATALCLVCSVAVSAAAVLLRPAQDANKLLDMQRNIVSVSQVDPQGRSVQEIFAAFEPRVLDIETGTFTDQFDPLNFDQRKAAKDPSMAKSLSKKEDIAGIGMRERYVTVYMLRDANGAIDRLILPVRGYGLWSTLWGFLALEGDGNTVIGLSFYEHAETPGLGGEVDNPSWKEQWDGKAIYDEDGDVEIRLVKGGVDHSKPENRYKVDSLSGATLTSQGVTNLLQYWMGDDGYRPFLENLQEGKV